MGLGFLLIISFYCLYVESAGLMRAVSSKSPLRKCYTSENDDQAFSNNNNDDDVFNNADERMPWKPYSYGEHDIFAEVQSFNEGDDIFRKKVNLEKMPLTSLYGAETANDPSSIATLEELCFFHGISLGNQKESLEQNPNNVPPCYPKSLHILAPRSSKRILFHHDDLSSNLKSLFSSDDDYWGTDVCINKNQNEGASTHVSGRVFNSFILSLIIIIVCHEKYPTPVPSSYSSCDSKISLIHNNYNNNDHEHEHENYNYRQSHEFDIGPNQILSAVSSQDRLSLLVAFKHFPGPLGRSPVTSEIYPKRLDMISEHFYWNHYDDEDIEQGSIIDVEQEFSTFDMLHRLNTASPIKRAKFLKSLAMTQSSYHNKTITGSHFAKAIDTYTSAKITHAFYEIKRLVLDLHRLMNQFSTIKNTITLRRLLRDPSVSCNLKDIKDLVNHALLNWNPKGKSPFINLDEMVMSEFLTSLQYEDDFEDEEWIDYNGCERRCLACSEDCMLCGLYNSKSPVNSNNDFMTRIRSNLDQVLIRQILFLNDVYERFFAEAPAETNVLFSPEEMNLKRICFSGLHLRDSTDEILAQAKIMKRRIVKTVQARFLELLWEIHGLKILKAYYERIFRRKNAPYFHAPFRYEDLKSLFFPYSNPKKTAVPTTGISMFLTSIIDKDLVREMIYDITEISMHAPYLQLIFPELIVGEKVDRNDEFVTAQDFIQFHLGTVDYERILKNSFMTREEGYSILPSRDKWRKSLVKSFFHHSRLIFDNAMELTCQIIPLFGHVYKSFGVKSEHFLDMESILFRKSVVERVSSTPALCQEKYDDLIGRLTEFVTLLIEKDSVLNIAE